LSRQITEPYQPPLAAAAEFKLKKASSDRADQVLARSINQLESQKESYEAKRKDSNVSYLELTTAYIDLMRAEATVADATGSAKKARIELAQAQPAVAELRQLAEEVLKNHNAAADLIEKLK